MMEGGSDSGGTVTIRAPGRVNLIGDHTDYTGGLVLPMAIDRWTTVTGRRGGDTVRLVSASEPMPAVVTLPPLDPAAVEPPWARYVAAVAAEVGVASGFDGVVTSTVPPGSSLSSSAALEVAVALTLGAPADAIAVARLCQRAEQRATGVPTGIMDQLASAAGREGHALLIDCHDLTVEAVPVPPEVEVVVVHSGETRRLAGSAYSDRAAQCAAAGAEIGPLRLATRSDVARTRTPLVRTRARHVVSENE